MKFNRPMEASSLIDPMVPDHQASLAKDPVSRVKHHLASLVRDQSLVRVLQSLVRDQAEVGVIVVVNTNSKCSSSYREGEEEEDI